MTPRNVALLRPAENSILENDFAVDVLRGLSAKRKSLPPRYFYDVRGSALFEEITQLPEYYLTRTEIAILDFYAKEICDGASPGDVLLEFGSGSSRKTEILLDALPPLAAYVAIDVSRSALDDARRRLSNRFPLLVFCPIVADFSHPISYPLDLADRRRIGFFPGSTIGNLTPAAATRLLDLMRDALGHGGRLIIGVDLKKDTRRLVAAYNDSSGVTAAFNLNMLMRINRELGGNFELGAFRHRAVYNPREGRMEMHIVSLGDQRVRVLDRLFRFRRGESIHTENSYKYSTNQFKALAETAGWNVRQVWLDENRLFGVHELVAPM